MEEWLRAAKRFQRSDDPNLKTAANRIMDEYSDKFRGEAFLRAKSDKASHDHTELNFTTPELESSYFAESLPKPNEIPKIGRNERQQDFGRELVIKGIKGETPLKTLELYEEQSTEEQMKKLLNKSMM